MSICPYCSKNTLEKIKDGYYKCSKCGYDMQSPSLIKQGPFIKSIEVITAVFGLLPLFVYLGIIFTLSIFGLETILGIRDYFDLSKIEDIVLFAVLFLALIDLTFLALKTHLRPVIMSFLGFDESSEQRSYFERTYPVRLAVIGTIAILMGVFADLFRCGASDGTSKCTDMQLFMFGVTLFGVAIVLVAIGLYEKYNSEAKK